MLFRLLYWSFEPDSTSTAWYGNSPRYPDEWKLFPSHPASRWWCLHKGSTWEIAQNHTSLVRRHHARIVIENSREHERKTYGAWQNLVSRYMMWRLGGEECKGVYSSVFPSSKIVIATTYSTVRVITIYTTKYSKRVLYINKFTDKFAERISCGFVSDCYLLTEIFHTQ